MKRTGPILFVFGALILSAGLATSSLRLSAQDQPGFSGNKVTPLIKMDLTGVTNRQVIANINEVPPGARFLFTFITAMNSPGTLGRVGRPSRGQARLHHEGWRRSIC